MTCWQMVFQRLLKMRIGNGEIKNDQEKCGNSGVSCLLKMGSNSDELFLGKRFLMEI